MSQNRIVRTGILNMYITGAGQLKKLGGRKTQIAVAEPSVQHDDHKL